MRGMSSLLAAAALVVAAAAATGCGADRESREPVVAVPVDPGPLPSRTPGADHSPDAGTPTATATPTPTVRPRTARSNAILSARDKASFDQLSASLGGASGVAVAGLGLDRKVEQAGPLRTGVAWSTSKVPVAMAVIAAGAGSAHARDLTQAITASDNAAAVRLWDALGGGTSAAAATDAQLRQSGDHVTEIESRALAGPQYTPFGQTMWSLADQTRFTAGLPCSAAGAKVLALMGSVVAGQRWGLGSTGGAPAFKGGWGPGTDPGSTGGWLDRQMGVITVAGKPLAVAIATQPADGAHETGTRNLTAIADWVQGHANARALPGRARC